MNARFWTRHRESWVKLTLKPGQSLETFTRSRTDEGWSSSAERWEHQGEGVFVEWCDDGVDCDGRWERGGEAYCSLANLRAHEAYPPEEGIMLPAWGRIKSRQRDYAAEAAGY